MTVPLNRDIDHPNARHTAGTMMILHIILHILIPFEGFAFKFEQICNIVCKVIIVPSVCLEFRWSMLRFEGTVII